jgi:hypothetical protein
MATAVHRHGPRFSPRGAAVAELLTDLDSLVRREVNRAAGSSSAPLRLADGAGTDHWDRDAERIAAEVATALARLRDDLRRHPLPDRRPG